MGKRRFNIVNMINVQDKIREGECFNILYKIASVEVFNYVYPNIELINFHSRSEN